MAKCKLSNCNKNIDHVKVSELGFRRTSNAVNAAFEKIILKSEFRKSNRQTRAIKSRFQNARPPKSTDHKVHSSLQGYN